jgi:hypothetical protein
MKLAIARRIKRRTEAQNGVNRWVCTSAKNKEKKKTKKLLTRPTSLEMYRKRELASGSHEHSVFARFRYNDLKEAAVIAADAGLMQIEWSGGVACRCAGVVRRSTTADTMSRKVGYEERML